MLIRYFLNYRALGISITPKAHIIFIHVVESIKATGKPLGVFSEQTTEAAHHEFLTAWRNYKANPSAPNYQQKLLSSVTRFNGERI